jgi:hypothetical protein
MKTDEQNTPSNEMLICSICLTTDNSALSIYRLTVAFGSSTMNVLGDIDEAHPCRISNEIIADKCFIICLVLEEAMMVDNLKRTASQL